MINDKRYITQAGPNRRNFIKGAGLALMLPQFASLAKTKKEIEPPVRIAFFTVPNGKILDAWRPKETGKNYTMSQTLKPIEHLRDHFQILTGLDHKNAYANGDGAGDHARSQGTFLTGVQILKNKEKARAGISVDQAAARYLGKKTYLPSLELSTSKGRLSGTCDSGYSCLYQYNFSWASDVMPMVPESDAQRAFDRLFTLNDGTKASKKSKHLINTEKSILDIVGESTKDLQRKLSKEDLSKLDQYYSSLRDTEKQLNRNKPNVHPSQVTRDFSKEPETYAESIEILMDVMALAFEVDATRVSSMIIENEGNNRPFPELGISAGHHYLSHNDDDESNAKKQKIDQFYIERMAHFLNALDKRKVDGKTLLEQSMIIYGSGHADGNKHTHSSLPILLAGHGGGKLQPGYHRDYGSRPMCDLYVRMLQDLGCPVNKFGDSTGIVEEV